MMATMSDAVICALRNFSAACLGAHLIGDRHAGLIEEQHQQPAILVLDLARFGRSDGWTRPSTARGWLGVALAAAAAQARARCSSRRWNSKTLICCGLPSSVTVKSEAFSPSMDLPLLSFAATLTTTSWVVASNLIGALWRALLCSPAGHKRQTAQSVRWQ